MKKGILIVVLLSFSVLLLFAYRINSNGSIGSNGFNDSNDSNTSHKQIKGDKANEVYKVVIDPGHGGEDKGSTGASNRYEKDFTLSLGKKVEKLLEKNPNIKVYMTREDDTFISQTSRYRPKYANKLNADLYISIHGNTFNDRDVSGTQTFYYHMDSFHFAEIMQKHVAKGTGFPDRGVKKEDLFVLKDTKMPAVLIEVGYLTNPHDEAKMFTEEFQKRVATSIVEGIKEYRTSSEKQGIKNWFY